jgi:Ca2+-transporting ATPase
MIIGITMLISATLIYYSPFTAFFGFKIMQITDLLFSVLIGFISVIWYEIVKAWKRRRLEVSHKY